MGKRKWERGDYIPSISRELKVFEVREKTNTRKRLSEEHWGYSGDPGRLVSVLVPGISWYTCDPSNGDVWVDVLHPSEPKRPARRKRNKRRKEK